MRPEAPSATEEPRAWPASKRVRMGPVSKPPAASSRILSGSIEMQSGVVFLSDVLASHCRGGERHCTVGIPSGRFSELAGIGM